MGAFSVTMSGSMIWTVRTVSSICTVVKSRPLFQMAHPAATHPPVLSLGNVECPIDLTMSNHRMCFHPVTPSVAPIRLPLMFVDVAEKVATGCRARLRAQGMVRVMGQDSPCLLKRLQSAPGCGWVGLGQGPFWGLAPPPPPPHTNTLTLV